MFRARQRQRSGALIGQLRRSGDVAVKGRVIRAENGSGGDTAGVDSILDRLEKRLLDQENDGLTFTWPVKHPSREDLERVAAQLRAAL